MPLTTCEDCDRKGMAACPRHGLERSTKKKRSGSPTLKRTPLAPASDKRKDEKRDWMLIKKAMLRAQLLTNGHTSCMECGAQNPKPIDLDHEIPSGKGGPWTVSNAVLKCRPCHAEKHGTPKWSKTK